MQWEETEMEWYDDSPMFTSQSERLRKMAAQIAASDDDFIEHALTIAAAEIEEEGEAPQPEVADAR